MSSSLWSRPPSSGRSKGRFSPIAPPLESNVIPHVRYDPNIVYHSESRAFVRTVRAVFGGLFGVLPGLWLAGRFGQFSFGVIGATVGVSIVACACLAAYLGDEFWHKASQAIRSIF